MCAGKRYGVPDVSYRATFGEHALLRALRDRTHPDHTLLKDTPSGRAVLQKDKSKDRSGAAA